MRKTYEATNLDEVEAIIMQIIIEKVKEIAGEKKVNIIISNKQGDE